MNSSTSSESNVERTAYGRPCMLLMRRETSSLIRATHERQIGVPRWSRMQRAARPSWVADFSAGRARARLFLSRPGCAHGARRAVACSSPSYCVTILVIRSGSDAMCINVEINVRNAYLSSRQGRLAAGSPQRMALTCEPKRRMRRLHAMCEM